mgnify:FL=1
MMNVNAPPSSGESEPESEFESEPESDTDEHEHPLYLAAKHGNEAEVVALLAAGTHVDAVVPAAELRPLRSGLHV